MRTPALVNGDTVDAVRMGYGIGDGTHGASDEGALMAVMAEKEYEVQVAEVSFLQKSAVPHVDPVKRRQTMRGAEAIWALKTRLETVPATHCGLPLTAVTEQTHANWNLAQ